MNMKYPIAAAAVIVIAVAAVVLNQHESEAAIQQTNDAYVQADLVRVAPRINGVIEQVLVEEYQQVKAGDVLVQLDDELARNAVEQAGADVKAAEAALSSLLAGVDMQRQTVNQTRASLKMDKARLALAKLEMDRFDNLAMTGAGSSQNKQKSHAEYQIELATLEKDRALLAAAEQQITVLQANILQAEAGLAKAVALQQQAELQLSYTRIVAPVDGVVARRTARSGGYVQTGSELLTLVPDSSLYIEANYRETQLAQMSNGQKVHIQVDALPGQTFSGVVERLGPASGVSLSAVPAHNATGNFTKVVQRLPVRIRLLDDSANLVALKVGMSVETSVDVNSQVSADVLASLH